MTTAHEGPHNLVDARRQDTGPADDRPLTYSEAEATYRDKLLTAGRDRYEELTDRELGASTAALLRERREFGRATRATRPSRPGDR